MILNRAKRRYVPVVVVSVLNTVVYRKVEVDGGLQALANIRYFKNLDYYTQTQIGGGLLNEF